VAARVSGRIAAISRTNLVKTLHTAQILTWSTAVFCLVRGLPVLLEGWKYFAGSLGQGQGVKSASHNSVRDAKTAALEAA